MSSGVAPTTAGSSEPAEFNSQSIQHMNYRQIIEANRRQHKGTFMDRSWRSDPEANGTNTLNDPTLSRWQKFTGGAYTY